VTDAPIAELVLSPRWVLTNVVIDDTPHTVLRIEHPRFGPLDFMLPGNDAMNLAAGLAKTAERREAVQLGGIAPTEHEGDTPIRTNRDAPTSFWSKIVRSKD
jgi:hypothetical protein